MKWKHAVASEISLKSPRDTPILKLRLFTERKILPKRMPSTVLQNVMNIIYATGCARLEEFAIFTSFLSMVDQWFGKPFRSKV